MKEKSLLVRLEKFVHSNLILISILVVSFFIRLPSLLEPLSITDESIYLTIGQKIVRGGILYLDAFDHKTPLIYYLTAAVIKLFGPSFWSFRFTLLIWALVTLVVFYFLGKKLFGQKIALVATAFFSLLINTPLFEGNTVNGEILMALPIVLGMLLGLNRKFFLSGICFSIAFLFKVPAIFDFAALVFFICLSFDRKGIKSILRNILKLALGFSIPFLFTIAFFATKGALGAYFDAAFLFNVSYTNYNNYFLFENGLLLIKALPILVVLIYFAKKVFLDNKSNKTVEISFFEFLLIWLSFSFYGVLFAGRPYEHYLIQIAAPVSLIAAVCIFRKELTKVGGLILASSVVLIFAFRFQPSISPTYYWNFLHYTTNKTNFDAYAGTFKGKTARNYALSSFLKGCSLYKKGGSCERSRTSSGDKLYVFADAPAIYFLSGLDPATRYVNFYHALESQNIKEEVAKNLIKTKPKYILVEADKVNQFPQLENILKDRYNLFAFYEDMGIYQNKQTNPL